MAKKKSFHVYNKEEKITETLDVLNEYTMDHLRKKNYNLFVFILNILGSIAWVYSYLTGVYTDWWVLVLIGICVITAIGSGIKLFRNG